MPVAKALAILVQQVVGHFELTVVDCFFNSFNCGLDFHLVSFVALYGLEYTGSGRNGKRFRQIGGGVAGIQQLKSMGPVP